MMDISWIDRTEYPFKSNFIGLKMGKVHYVDEGNGEPIVMLHGNPTWSFLYRHLVKGLSSSYRCVAIDYIGFGLSDKPPNWSYLPQDHAKNIENLIKELELKDITLVVHDWGGPIGISYAVNHPENVKRLIIMNTWAWPVSNDEHFRWYSKFLGGRLGKLLVTRLRFLESFIMKKLTKNKKRFTKEVHRHYLKQFSSHKDRKGVWIFPKEIMGSTQWLETLWSQKERIHKIPALLVWGMKDMAFREKELHTWEGLFLKSKTVKFNNAGHYVQEEAGPDLLPIITKFLKKIK